MFKRLDYDPDSSQWIIVDDEFTHTIPIDSGPITQIIKVYGAKYLPIRQNIARYIQYAENRWRGNKTWTREEILRECEENVPNWDVYKYGVLKLLDMKTETPQPKLIDIKDAPIGSRVRFTSSIYGTVEATVIGRSSTGYSIVGTLENTENQFFSEVSKLSSEGVYVSEMQRTSPDKFVKNFSDYKKGHWWTGQCEVIGLPEEVNSDTVQTISPPQKTHLIKDASLGSEVSEINGFRPEIKATIIGQGCKARKGYLLLGWKEAIPHTGWPCIGISALSTELKEEIKFSPNHFISNVADYKNVFWVRDNTSVGTITLPTPTVKETKATEPTSQPFPTMKDCALGQEVIIKGIKATVIGRDVGVKLLAWKEKPTGYFRDCAWINKDKTIGIAKSLDNGKRDHPTDYVNNTDDYQYAYWVNDSEECQPVSSPPPKETKPLFKDLPLGTKVRFTGPDEKNSTPGVVLGKISNSNLIGWGTEDRTIPNAWSLNQQYNRESIRRQQSENQKNFSSDVLNYDRAIWVPSNGHLSKSFEIVSEPQTIPDKSMTKTKVAIKDVPIGSKVKLENGSEATVLGNCRLDYIGIGHKMLIGWNDKRFNFNPDHQWELRTCKGNRDVIEKEVLRYPDKYLHNTLDFEYGSSIDQNAMCEVIDPANASHKSYAQMKSGSPPPRLMKLKDIPVGSVIKRNGIDGKILEKGESDTWEWWKGYYASVAGDKPISYSGPQNKDHEVIHLASTQPATKSKLKDLPLGAIVKFANGSQGRIIATLDKYGHVLIGWTDKPRTYPTEPEAQPWEAQTIISRDMKAEPHRFLSNALDYKWNLYVQQNIECEQLFTPTKVKLKDVPVGAKVKFTTGIATVVGRPDGSSVIVRFEGKGYDNFVGNDTECEQLTFPKTEPTPMTTSSKRSKAIDLTAEMIEKGLIVPDAKEVDAQIAYIMGLNDTEFETFQKTINKVSVPTFSEEQINQLVRELQNIDGQLSLPKEEPKVDQSLFRNAPPKINTKVQQVQTIKEETKPMSNNETTPPTLSFVDTFKKEGKDAMYRVASNQMTKAVKNGFLAMFKAQGWNDGKLGALSEFLDTDIGSALISGLLGHGLPHAPMIGNDPRAQKLAQEFRVAAYAQVGNTVFDGLMEHIMPAITGAMSALPSLESGVETMKNQLTGNKTVQTRVATPPVETSTEHEEQEEAIVEARSAQAG